MAFAMFVFGENNTACGQRSSFTVARGDANPTIEKHDELTPRRVV
jgi:hypothetical protein